MKRFETPSFLRLGFCLALLGAWMAAASIPPAADLAELAAPCPTSPSSSSIDARDLFGLTVASGSQCCIDQCRQDKHCDDFCGAPEAGVCIQVNSCCRECACLF